MVNNLRGFSMKSPISFVLTFAVLVMAAFAQEVPKQNYQVAAETKLKVTKLKVTKPLIRFTDKTKGDVNL